jgi:hypothetical protein
MRFNEFTEQLSEDFDPIKRQHLDDLISQYRDATDPIGYDDDARDPDEVIAQIRQEFGDKIANDLEQGPSSHFSRDNHSMGYDSLKHSGSPRVTKLGKVNRQDVTALKSRLQQRMGSHNRPNLPEQRVAEGNYDNRDAYQRDYDNSQTNFGRGERDSERHDIDTNNEYRAEHGTWYIRIDGVVDPTPYQGKAAANAAGLELKKQPGNENKLFMLTTKA